MLLCVKAQSCSHDLCFSGRDGDEKKVKTVSLGLHYSGVCTRFTVTSQTIAQHACTVFYISGESGDRRRSTGL